MLKHLIRSRLVLETASVLVSGYLRLVRATNRFVHEPPGFLDRVSPELPVIVAMWHGQHFMIHYAWPPDARVAALISRHRDAELNALVLKRLGREAHPRLGADGPRRRGGAAA